MRFKHVLIALAILAVLGIGYYALSPLFRNVELNEPSPEVLMEEAMKEAAETPGTLVDETMPSMPKGTIAADAKIFPIVDTAGHPASGSVRVLETPEGKVVRYENFETINGPRLHVYLAKDLDAKEYVDLGPIKGTRGNINYPVPEDVDVKEYRYVMYWCVPFSVLFNYADLAP